MKRDKDAVGATLVTILERVLPLDGSSTTLDRNAELLGVMPGFDSQSVISLLLEIENEFDIEIDDDAVVAETFATVGTLAEFVIECLGDEA